jgi:hypothetical protein
LKIQHNLYFQKKHTYLIYYYKMNFLSQTVDNSDVVKKIGIMNNFYFHYECLGYLIEYSLYYLNASNKYFRDSPERSEGDDQFSAADCGGKFKGGTETGSKSLLNLSERIVYKLQSNTSSHDNYSPQSAENLLIYIQYYDDIDFINWKTFYNKLFNLTDKNWRRSEQFDNDNIDILFLATDDDFGFKIEWINKYKIISIGHSTIRQIYNDTSNFLNIYTRYSKYSNKENEKWCFPVFEAVSRDEKKLNRKNNLYLDGGYDIHVVCVGACSQPHPEQPSVMFLNNGKIKFSVINRRIIHDYSNVSNIDNYESLNSELFFDILKNADYIMCFNYNEKHTLISLTGSFNLAFSFGAKLLIPKEWQDNLNISSAMSYDFKETPFNLPSITDADIDAIYDERAGYINHRNDVFNNAISTFFTGTNIEVQGGT